MMLEGQWELRTDKIHMQSMPIMERSKETYAFTCFHCCDTNFIRVLSVYVRVAGMEPHLSTDRNVVLLIKLKIPQSVLCLSACVYIDS